MLSKKMRQCKEMEARKASKISLIAITGLLLLAGAAWHVSAEVWREKRDPASGYDYGPRGSGAWAYVGGWWGIAYCGFAPSQGRPIPMRVPASKMRLD